MSKRMTVAQLKEELDARCSAAVVLIEQLDRRVYAAYDTLQARVDESIINLADENTNLDIRITKVEANNDQYALAQRVSALEAPPEQPVVYCRECQYCKVVSYGKNGKWDRCRKYPEAQRRWTLPPYGVRHKKQDTSLRDFKYCYGINANGHCPDYEPKRPWWRRLF